MVIELAQLAELHDNGKLTDEQFEAAKKTLLQDDSYSSAPGHCSQRPAGASALRVRSC